MSSAVELVASLISLVGALFHLAGAIGLLRLPDFYARLHAPTKAATLGIVLIALGSTILHLERDLVVWTEDALIILFVMLTTPVSSQVLARAAASRGVAQMKGTRGDPLPPAHREGEEAGIEEGGES
jgi:multicomponent K+:H+ antiporter subunit G